MELQTKILELIPLLDSENDALIIHLLRQALSKEQFNQKVIKNFGITEVSVTKAKMGMKRTLKVFLDNEHFECDRARKIELILDRSGCSNCKHAEVVEGYKTRYYAQDDSKICDRCIKRSDRLYDIKWDRISRINKFSEKVIENLDGDFIKTKCLINKINLKLQNYDAS